ncbi:DUF4376 domain-containing protein [Cetobacterium sp.]|uniref:DUF4376 domain-containing protein n=1 Tax=Cetobacterium sp. TaxID=2071632 RepID=UPI003F2BA289
MVENKYIYISKEEAKKGTALVFAVTDEPIKNMEEYFEGRACLFVGEDLPHFITYLEDKNIIREATEEEKLARNQRTLNENEIINKNGVIELYDTYTQKIINNEIIDKTRDDYINENLITLDSEKNKARNQRKNEMKSVDLYDKAVLRGDIEESEDMKKERDEYRRKWLELPNSYENIIIPIEELYPQKPLVIEYFNNSSAF